MPVPDRRGVTAAHDRTRGRLQIRRIHVTHAKLGEQFTLLAEAETGRLERCTARQLALRVERGAPSRAERSKGVARQDSSSALSSRVCCFEKM
jgi:hypothetical protein